MHAQSTAQEDRAADVTPPVVPRMPWRVHAVRVLPGYRLDVTFVDGTRGETDLSALIHSEDAGVFASLRDPALFSRARVVYGAVTWPGEIDLAPDALYRQMAKAD